MNENEKYQMYLTTFLAGVDHVLAGESVSEALKELRVLKESINYSPVSLEEIDAFKGKDIFEQERILLELKVAHIQNERYRRSLLEDDRLTAWKFVRVGFRKPPRNWDRRWKQAYNALTGEEKETVMQNEKIALIESPIWGKLSRFGKPYPPFDYDSGMRVEVVPWPKASQEEPTMICVNGKMVNLRQWIDDNLTVSPYHP